MSDLHVEARGRHFLRDEPQPGHDAVVLAGDIFRLRRAIAWAAGTFTKPVILVPGVHDFSGSFFFTELQAAREAAAGTHVALLDNRSLTLGGVRLLGATLWSDFELFGPERRDEAMAACAERVTECREIGYGMGYDAERRHYLYHPMTPNDARAQHDIGREWLEKELQHGERLGRNGSTVVVTHHAPSRRSLPPRWRSDLVSAASAFDLTGLIERYQPALWIHGHLHARVDYRIGRTRVLANACGYRWERTEFDPALVVEIGDAVIERADE